MDRQDRHDSPARPTRPFISFLTDFGPDGAAAICRGVMLGIAPDATILDISHSVTKFAVREGAFLLWTALRWMPAGVHVAVIDPGVGTDRRPIAIRTGRGDVLVGPDNGLLIPAADSLGGIAEGRLLENPAWRLPRTSATFHGRDIFAPAAAHLAGGAAFEDAGPVIDRATLVPLRFPAATVREGRLETAVAYVDSFGNIRLGATRADLEAALGHLASGGASGGGADGLRVTFDRSDGSEPTSERVPLVATFGAVAPGAPMLYVDSNGQLAYADNQGSAGARLRVDPDARVVISR